MFSAPKLIKDWIAGGRKRNFSALSRETGVSAAEISLIMRGKKPSRDTVIRLGKALEPVNSFALLMQVDPAFQDLFQRCVLASKETLT